MTRVVDRQALVAAGVGIGVAVTIGVSFLLVIPIEPVYWYLTIPSGLLIGYYSNQRAGRRGGAWPRILANALAAGAITGVTFALLLLAVKALFFTADNGYPDFNRTDGNGVPIPPVCQPGADCVYRRYLAAGRAADLTAAGIVDADTFSRFYWANQLSTAGLLLVFATAGGVAGGVLFRVANRSPGADTDPALDPVG
ncbi:MAG TPA: hypothetical protein VH720_08565 [Candidatus Limnocylindrales bacterium]